MRRVHSTCGVASSGRFPGPVYDHIRAEEGYASCARTGHPYLSPGEGHPSLGLPRALPHAIGCPSRSRTVGLDQGIGMEADWHDQEVVGGLRTFCHLVWRRSVSSCGGTKASGPELWFPGAWTAAKGRLPTVR